MYEPNSNPAFPIFTQEFTTARELNSPLACDSEVVLRAVIQHLRVWWPGMRDSEVPRNLLR
jgi:hypothetical protein